MEKEYLEMSKELYNVLAQVKGVKGISEEVSLCYIIIVEDDAAKDNVEKVAAVLQKQAAAHKLILDIEVATEKEVQDIRSKLATEKTFS